MQTEQQIYPKSSAENNQIFNLNTNWKPVNISLDNVTQIKNFSKVNKTDF